MRAKEQTASLTQQSEKEDSLIFSDSISRFSSSTIIRDESDTIRLLPYASGENPQPSQSTLCPSGEEQSERSRCAHQTCGSRGNTYQSMNPLETQSAKGESSSSEILSSSVDEKKRILR